VLQSDDSLVQLPTNVTEVMLELLSDRYYSVF